MNEKTEAQHTPGPWKICIGGGHKASSIRGSDAIHTNGFLRNALGCSSASYSAEVCEIHADLSLPGPAANANLIIAAPETAAERDRLKALVSELAIELRSVRRNLDYQFTGKYLKRLDAVLAKAKEVEKE